MRLIPVLDLVAGRAVHARRGQRESYQPVQSRLAPQTSDPVLLCEAFVKWGFQEVYIADLDAIAGRGDHLEQIQLVTARTGIRPIVDAGLRTAARITDLIHSGVSTVVVGTETLGSLEELGLMLKLAGPERLLFSLDLRAGLILSPNPTVAKANPLDLLRAAAHMGVQQALVLDLATVGAEDGPALGLAGAAAAALPELAVLVGGGVRHGSDLEAAADAGMAGVLIATCLHTGALTKEEVRAWI
jgi:phosphoribosylformimino-5-aminoimidazole carboxamide ribotide isomerase